jgi:hypothetical protein
MANPFRAAARLTASGARDAAPRLDLVWRRGRPALFRLGRVDRLAGDGDAVQLPPPSRSRAVVRAQQSVDRRASSTSSRTTSSARTASCCRRSIRTALDTRQGDERRDRARLGRMAQPGKRQRRRTRQLHRAAERQIIDTIAVDGECFVSRLRGFPNKFGYALQIVDADLVDETYNVGAGPNQNRIRMGVEIDRWNRAVAYHVWTRYAEDMDGLERKRERVPAEEMHAPLRPLASREHHARHHVVRANPRAGAHISTATS